MAKIDSRKIIQHLEQKWRGKGCTQCGVANWQVQDSTFELREFNAGNMVLGGPVIPVVPVICANCGNTVLINALISGVMARGPEKEP
jgi:hypothetical protein